jgi:hypothetical protein
MQRVKIIKDEVSSLRWIQELTGMNVAIVKLLK